MAPRIPLVRPDLGDSEAEAAARTVRSGWVTQGPEVAHFEAEFAAAVGAPHAVAVANCTVALELALKGVGVRPGDEVITVSHSFIATANSVVAVGATPVFIDVTAATLGMDPAALDAAITPRTKAVLCVHQVGIPCDLAGILAIADRHGLPVIEDAACAIGSEVNLGDRWERVGKPHGVVACFSLHPRKVITTGDGGMLTTADPALARQFRLWRQHAMSIPDTVRHHADTIVFEDYLEPAYNYRMTDLQAAIGRPQLARLAAIIAERRRLADRLASALADHPLLIAPRDPAGTRCNWQSYPVAIRPDSPLDQRTIMQAFLDAGIATKRGISNAHQELAYRGTDRWRCAGQPDCDHAPGHCPHLQVSERLRDTTILLPLFHGMRDDEMEAIIGACQTLAETAGERG